VDPVPKGFSAYTPDPAVLLRSVTRVEKPPAPPLPPVGYAGSPTPLPRPSVAPRPPQAPHADDPAPLLKSVKSLADTGALDRARAAAALLVKRYPRLAAAHWLSGMVELDAADVHGALRFFERAVALEPGFAMAHFGLATALQRGGRRAEARAALVRLNHLLAPLPAETQLTGPEPINCGWLKTIVEAQLRD
jgi:tetratricopeptide (TPR) repeat protein